MTMYDGYNDSYSYSSVTGADSTWIIISVVLAVIGGIVAYYMFAKKKNNNNNSFVSWLHDFLNFKTFILSDLLKILYTCSFIFITLASFGFIRVSVAAFFGILLVGNLINRLFFEMMLMFIQLVNNSNEINKKLGKPAEKTVSVEKTEKVEKPKKTTKKEEAAK